MLQYPLSQVIFLFKVTYFIQNSIKLKAMKNPICPSHVQSNTTSTFNCNFFNHETFFNTFYNLFYLPHKQCIQTQIHINICSFFLFLFQRNHFACFMLLCTFCVFTEFHAFLLLEKNGRSTCISEIFFSKFSILLPLLIVILDIECSLN